ncbi:hypothetical protein LCGC14_1408310 [marine sediment metagenome]|uniref:Uncharacterized protein n=1 Tax=marine sediment metagenome TaxID=412755 RepID=A0A0F9MWM6_9ZZZZ
MIYDRFEGAFHSVQLWADPWPRRVKVIKMYDNDCLSGHGWISLNEYATHKEALTAARYARNLMAQGETDDAIFTLFGHILPQPAS